MHGAVRGRGLITPSYSIFTIDDRFFQLRRGAVCLTGMYGAMRGRTIALPPLFGQPYSPNVTVSLTGL